MVPPGAGSFGPGRITEEPESHQVGVAHPEQHGWKPLGHSDPQDEISVNRKSKTHLPVSSSLITSAALSLLA